MKIRGIDVRAQAKTTFGNSNANGIQDNAESDKYDDEGHHEGSTTKAGEEC